MKYSLKSLMILVTLVCVVLGSMMGRVEYLRRCADYHEREAVRYASKPQVSDDQDYNDSVWYRYHTDLALSYRSASQHRWNLYFIDDSPPFKRLRTIQ